MRSRVVFESRYGRGLTVAVGVAAAAALVVLALDDVTLALRALPITAAVVFAARLVFWAPRVIVDDDAVTVVGVLRTVTVPWGALQEAVVGPSLELVTAAGNVGVWAAPRRSAIGRRRARRAANAANKSAVEHREEAAAKDALPSPEDPRWIRGARPGEASGVDKRDASAEAVAEELTARLRTKRSRGNGADAVHTRWHLTALSVLAALVAAGIVLMR